MSKDYFDEMEKRATNIGVDLYKLLDVIDRGNDEGDRKTYTCFVCNKLMRSDPCNPKYPVGGSLIDNTWASKWDTFDKRLFVCDDCFGHAFGEAYMKWDS